MLSLGRPISCQHVASSVGASRGQLDAANLDNDLKSLACEILLNGQSVKLVVNFWRKQRRPFSRTIRRPGTTALLLLPSFQSS